MCCRWNWPWVMDTKFCFTFSWNHRIVTQTWKFCLRLLHSANFKPFPLWNQRETKFRNFQETQDYPTKRIILIFLLLLPFHVIGPLLGYQQQHTLPSLLPPQRTAIGWCSWTSLLMVSIPRHRSLIIMWRLYKQFWAGSSIMGFVPISFPLSCLTEKRV